MFRGFQSAAGRIRVCVADEEDGLFLVACHANGEVVCGGVFTHHAGGDDEDASAGEFHFLHLTGVEDDEVQRFVQLEIGVIAVRAVRFEIVNLGEHATESADVDRLLFEFAVAYEQGEQCQDFLSATERERRDHHATFFLDGFMDGGDETVHFSGASDAFGNDFVPARGFHDEHVSFDAIETRGAENGLIVKANVAGVEHGCLLAAQHDAC